MHRRNNRFSKPPAAEPNAAREMALAALQFVAAEPERIGALLAESGLDPRELRALVDDPVFLAGILDHLLGNEALLLEFCAESGIGPERVLPARDSMAAAGGMGPLRVGRDA